MPYKIRERAAWMAKNVLPHERAIRGWLGRNRLGDLEIDDIVQETYARIVSLDDFDQIRNPKKYVYQVAHSVVVDHLRRARIVSILPVANIDKLGLAGPEPDLEQRAAFNEEIAAVSDALSGLSQMARDVLMMRRVAGFSQRETAERLRIAGERPRGGLVRRRVPAPQPQDRSELRPTSPRRGETPSRNE